MPIALVERFHNGRWIQVQSVDVGGQLLVVKGGWLRTASLDAEDCVEHELLDPPGCVDQLRKHRPEGLKVDLLTFAQMLPDTEPKYAYPMERESIAAISLTSFSTWWDGLPQEVRKNVRRAEKRGVVTCMREVDDVLVQGIVDINNETPVRQGRRFTHYGESFEKVKTDFLAFKERSDLICAYSGPELIGVVKIIYSGPIAAIMKLQTKISHADKRPANALLARAIERCHEVGALYVTYGSYRYGNQAWTSLMEFKRRHGFVEIEVPRYYVPLSARGAGCVKLRLHRGIVGVLPSSVLHAGRSLRARWKSRRLAGVAQR
jgi:hypothetical protein